MNFPDIRYKYLWLLAAVMLFLDMGTTLYMINNGFAEGNETVVRMMEQHGEVLGLAQGVGLRLGMLAVGITLQAVTIEKAKPIMIGFLFPACAAPPVHNIVLYFTGVSLLL